MPRVVSQLEAKSKRWNMYISELEKAEFMTELLKNGKVGAASAAVRAFIHLYINDNEVKEKVNSIIDDYIIYNKNGTPSKL